jgi:hypothetical protein
MSTSYSEAVTSNFIAPTAISKTYYLVRREVNTAINIKIMLFRDPTSCSYVENLKTEAVDPSNSWYLLPSMNLHIPEGLAWWSTLHLNIFVHLYNRDWCVTIQIVLSEVRTEAEDKVDDLNRAVKHNKQ